MWRARRFEAPKSFSTWWRELYAVAKLSGLSWACFLVLLIVLASLEATGTPFVRHVAPEDWEYLKFPYGDNTIPSSVVPVFSLVLPVLLAVVYHFAIGCEIREFHDLVFSILMNVVMTGTVTSALKLSIGRLRPNYFRRCYQETYNLTEKLVFEDYEPPPCTNPDHGDVVDGRKSFPSGHSSWTMCSMFYVTLFLIGKLEVFDGRGHMWKLVVSVLPTCLAIATGITRINDYMHHWTDVLAGLLLGMVMASMVYLMYYPWPFARRGTCQPLYQTLSDNEFLAQAGQNGGNPVDCELDITIEEGLPLTIHQEQRSGTSSLRVL